MSPSTSLRALRDALADADGHLRVTEARRDEGRAQDEPLKPSILLQLDEDVAAAQRRVDRAREALIEAETSGPEQNAAPASDAPAAPDRVPAFTTVEHFVDAYLLEHWRRESLKWCAVWWRHSEAIDRLRALWLAWEASRYEGPMAMAVWWRDYADPTMAVLTSRSGPFAHCDHSNASHTLLKRANVQTAPPGLLDEV